MLCSYQAESYTKSCTSLYFHIKTLNRDFCSSFTCNSQKQPKFSFICEQLNKWWYILLWFRSEMSCRSVRGVQGWSFWKVIRKWVIVLISWSIDSLMCAISRYNVVEVDHWERDLKGYILVPSPAPFSRLISCHWSEHLSFTFTFYLPPCCFCLGASQPWTDHTGTEANNLLLL